MPMAITWATETVDADPIGLPGPRLALGCRRARSRAGQHGRAEDEGRTGTGGARRNGSRGDDREHHAAAGPDPARQPAGGARGTGVGLRRRRPATRPDGRNRRSNAIRPFATSRSDSAALPSTYRFAVDPGAKRTVFLGFCESHHPVPGIRKLVAEVEGAPDQSIDPIAAWGRHMPGVVRFDASDADRDGRLQVRGRPPPERRRPQHHSQCAVDFSAGNSHRREPTHRRRLERARRALRRCRWRKRPESLRERQHQVLPRARARRNRDFFFLLRSPGCQALPDLSRSIWTPASLRRAAAEVWRDQWDGS